MIQGWIELNSFIYFFLEDAVMLRLTKKVLQLPESVTDDARLSPYSQQESCSSIIYYDQKYVEINPLS